MGISFPWKQKHTIDLSFVLSQITGFFKGLSFPLASIALYNSMVFGFFSNTQRLISRYRYGDGRHPCSMLDLTVASMLTGLVSVGMGAPVDLVKIRLQMQTQPVLAGKSWLCYEYNFAPCSYVWVKHHIFMFEEWLLKASQRQTFPGKPCVLQSFSHLLFCAFPENFNLAGNGSVPLRSMGIQSQSLYRGPVHCISTVLQNEGIQGLYRGAGAMILRDVPGYTLYFIPYTLFCNWLNPDGNATPHPCCICLAGGLAGKWDMGPIPKP